MPENKINIFINIINMVVASASLSLTIVSLFFILLPMYEQVRDLKIKQNIDFAQKDSFIVTLTTYNAVYQQTDESPFETSCGLKINPSNPQKQKYVALSRDLLNYFCYGDSIQISNCGKFNGNYVVADCTAKRLKNVVDILINRNTVGGKFDNVVIKRLY